MNPEERTRIAAGESEELPPPPPSAQGGEPASAPGLAPGTGGPDDAGDVDVDPDDLHIPRS